MTAAEGKSFDPTKIGKAVTDAGFSPGPIEVTATGTLRFESGLLRLQMPGPIKEFVLTGGSKDEELKQQAGLRGKRVRVRGELHPSHADKPPGLTVEWFEAGSR